MILVLYFLSLLAALTRYGVFETDIYVIYAWSASCYLVYSRGGESMTDKIGPYLIISRAVSGSKV
jgi:hypothetical protein